MRLRYKVKDANGMTIGAATSHAGAVAVAQQVQGAAYIYDANTERSFWLDRQEVDQILERPNLMLGQEFQANMKITRRENFLLRRAGYGNSPLAGIKVTRSPRSLSMDIQQASAP